MDIHNNLALAVNLNDDADFLRAIWLDNQSQVMDQLDKMLASGWTWTQDGLVSIGDEGPVIARPIKLANEKIYTGIGIWKHDHPTDK